MTNIYFFKSSDRKSDNKAYISLMHLSSNQPPPPEHRNGILKAFNVTVTTESSELLRPIQISKLTYGQAVSISIRYVPLIYNTTQRVCVSASTSVGFSRQFGCIVLPSGSKPSGNCYPVFNYYFA